MAPTLSPRKTSPHPHPQQPSKTPLSVALCGAAAVLTPHLGGDGRDASNESFRTAYRDQLIGSVDRSDRLTRAVARISSAKTHLITTQTLEFQLDKQPRCTHYLQSAPFFLPKPRRRIFMLPSARNNQGIPRHGCTRAARRLDRG